MLPVAGRFLTAADVEALTGLVQPRAQARWLRERGYRCEARPGKHPAILWAEVEARLVGVAKKRSTEPNWNSVNR